MNDYFLLFLGMDIKRSHSAAYNMNEFSLKHEPVLRISIRWRWGDLDCEQRNYDCYFADLTPAIEIFEIVDWLRSEYEELYGDDWFQESLSNFHYYLNHEFEVNKSNFMDTDRPNYKLDDFGDGAKLALLIALDNPVGWKQASMRATLEANFSSGHEGCHLDVVYDDVNDNSAATFRLLNSWENEPIYRAKDKTIKPVEYIAWRQDFL